jgi:hypothetical protein
LTPSSPPGVVRSTSPRAKAASVVLWSAFVVLALIIGWTVLRACGASHPLLDFCVRQPAAITLQVEEATARGESLARERDAWLERLHRAPQCTAQVEPEQPEEETEFAECQVPPADEALVVLDVSTSMGWDLNVDPSVIAELDRLQARFRATRNIFEQMQLASQIEAVQRRIASPAEPDRIDAARDALAPLAAGLPPEARLRLTTFAECGRPLRDEGSFGPADDAAYRARLRGIGLRESTALAEALRQIPSRTEAGRTEDRPVNIVIVSDGEDSCDGDPCAAARQLRQRLPHAQVSVVSLAAGRDVNRCIAEATGGSFHRVGDMDDLQLRLRQTLGQLDREECSRLAAEDGTEDEQ